MKFRIAEDKLLDNALERNEEIRARLGIDLPVSSGYNAFMTMFTDLKYIYRESESMCEASLRSTLEAIEAMSEDGKFRSEALLFGSYHIPHSNLSGEFKETVREKHRVENMDGCGISNGHSVEVLEESEDFVSISFHYNTRVYASTSWLFSEDLAKLKLSVNLRGKPTRVLAKIFGEKLVTQYLAKNPTKHECDLIFTDSYIPEWYRHLSKTEKLSSCMSKTSSSYDLPDTEHPTMAYEGLESTGLALVYDKVKKKVVGRTIFNKGSSGYLYLFRMYGSPVAHKIYNDLESTEFVRTNAPVSVKLKRIESEEGGVLAPYVDGIDYFEDDGTNLWATEHGDLESDYETGRLRDPEQWCNYYEEYVSNSQEMYDTPEYGMVCENAIYNHFVYVEDREEYYHESSVRCCADDEYRHEDDVFTCEDSGEYYPIDDEVCVEVGNWHYSVAECNVDSFVESCKDDKVIRVNGEVVYDPEEEEDEEAA